ncbi:integral membrane protein [Ilyonectria destructans]|nr:integral membrane protein [Ilyonectria destructans]
MGYSENSGAGDSTGYELRISNPIVVFISISIYNVIKLNILILVTFKKRNSLYFWSFLAATNRIIPYSIGFLLKNILLSLVLAMIATNAIILYVPIIILIICRMYKHLLLVNIIIILLNIWILILKYTDFYNFQTAYKALIYSVKLNLELNILNRLLKISYGNNTSGLLS